MGVMGGSKRTVPYLPVRTTAKFSVQVLMNHEPGQHLRFQARLRQR